MASTDSGSNDAIDTATLFTVMAFVAFSLVLVVGPVFLPPRSLLSKLFVWLAVVCWVVVPVFVGALVPMIAPGNTNPGYWASAAAWWHGRRANHDFCEENYAYSRFVAEFHNTWSSLPIIIIGPIGTWYSRHYSDLGIRIPLAFCTVSLVGIGSALFHCTLLNWPQLLDEAPMMCYLTALVYCLAEPGKERRFPALLAPALSLACVSFVVAYVVFNQYVIFLIAFTGGTVVLIVTSIVCLYPMATGMMKVVYLCALCMHCVGSTVWFLDHHLCDVFWRAQLHVVWHFGAGLTGYAFISAIVCYSAVCCGKTATLRLPRPAGILWPWSTTGCSGGWRLSESCSGWSWAPCAAPCFLLPFVEVCDSAPPMKDKQG
eukprot:NODE_7025_length_1616_cov_5.085292.p1 GENE.NODE_7025_length_1616_cov_5.085292~~NODE_7025_length_1616_cov_5.085292.p1  ORF type:complete len:373 (+),score=77.17 NODE_7025_length_1616_cov_5.085292:90-1208(+)